MAQPLSENLFRKFAGFNWPENPAARAAGHEVTIRTTSASGIRRVILNTIVLLECENDAFVRRMTERALARRVKALDEGKNSEPADFTLVFERIAQSIDQHVDPDHHPRVLNLGMELAQNERGTTSSAFFASVTNMVSSQLVSYPNSWDVSRIDKTINNLVALLIEKPNLLNAGFVEMCVLALRTPFEKPIEYRAFEQPHQKTARENRAKVNAGVISIHGNATRALDLFRKYGGVRKADVLLEYLFPPQVMNALFDYIQKAPRFSPDRNKLIRFRKEVADLVIEISTELHMRKQSGANLPPRYLPNPAKSKKPPEPGGTN